MFLIGDLQLIKSKLRQCNDKTCRTKSSIVSRGHFICMAFWRRINARGVAELIAVFFSLSTDFEAEISRLGL